MFTGPGHGLLGLGVDSQQRTLTDSHGIMVTQNAAHVGCVANQLDTGLGVGIVANDITQTDKFIDSISTGMFQHSLKSFEIGVDITDDCCFHVCL